MGLNYYKFDGNVFVSCTPYPFESVSEKVLYSHDGYIYALNKLNSEKSRKSFYVTSPSNLFIKKEKLNLITKLTSNSALAPGEINRYINERKVVSLNTSYKNWAELLNYPLNIYSNNRSFHKWSLTVVGLGDVGGTLVTGLRLLGGNYISKINIYDRDKNKIKRWEYECNQIMDSNSDNLVPVIPIEDESNIFNCDMFVFCVSTGVPEVGEKVSDVRLMQLKGNSKIVYKYAREARNKNFRGIFAIMSDPVDLLCKASFKAGLEPDQIRGYGLGVMNARASYYARKSKVYDSYNVEGRAFGPHGKGLIIANSIKNYDENISDYLTQKSQNANLEMRSVGFKPYIAPALSSGVFSIINTIKGDWQYSSIFLGGAFMGCRNRLCSYGTELEYYEDMPEVLLNKLQKTYDYLLNFKIDFI